MLLVFLLFRMDVWNSTLKYVTDMGMPSDNDDDDTAAATTTTTSGDLKMAKNSDLEDFERRPVSRKLKKRGR